MSATFWTQSVKAAINAARLDAEHFDPEYEKLERAFLATGNAQPLGTLLTYCKRGMQPSYVPGGEIIVVNSQHVGAHFINVDAAESTSPDFWDKKPRSRAKKYDILMNSTGVGTIGRVNCVLHDEKTVVDNHVTILRANATLIDPVYLAVFLNSRLGRQQTYKWQSGSSGQLEIYPDEIKRFLVVVPDRPTQKAIREKFEEAYAGHRRASGQASAAEQAAVALV